MVPNSPALALGRHETGARDLLVEVVQSRHDRAAEAHEVSGSRNSMGFGTQWRDLLADVHEAFRARGFQGQTVTPAGYKIPIVRDCLVYVWRLPVTADPSRFASSPSKINLFDASPPNPALFEPDFMGGTEPANEVSREAELESVVRAGGDTMPLVLVMVSSSPRQLQSIEWAVAELNVETGEVTLHGREVIWQPEPAAGVEVSDFDSFDSGPPEGPTIEPQEQEETEPDA